MTMLCNANAMGVEGVDIGDNIANSLMLDSGSSQYLSRTSVASPTNALKWTVSGSFKVGVFGATADNYLIGALNGVNQDGLAIDGGSNTYNFILNGVNYAAWVAKERDPTGHVFWSLIYDSANGTQANRLILSLNGVVQSTTVTLPLNQATNISAASQPVLIGKLPTVGRYVDGYLSTYIFVDGQALAQTSFGRTSADTGQWVNKTYTGTYGANGFKLDFTNSGALGTDSSGNGNNWTLNSITSANQYTDTPTNNFAVCNYLRGSFTLSKGNTRVTLTTQSANLSPTLKMTSGKWYWESTPVSGGFYMLGVIKANSVAPTAVGYTNASGYYYYYDGTKYNNGSSVAYGAAYTAADVIGFEFDADAGTLTAFKNGTSQGVMYSGLTGGEFFPSFCLGSTVTGIVDFNFGAKAFSRAPTSGYLSLNTANLPTPAIIKPSLHFNALLWTGTTNLARSFTGAGFRPDLVWGKARSAAYSHRLFDSVRGVAKQLLSNSTGEETDQTLDSAGYVSAFDVDGFSTASGTANNGNWNEPSVSFVAWLWKMGGAAVSNTNGSITSSVSANTLAGQSVVKITAGTAANATVGHGLLSAPELIIAKAFSQVTEWPVFCSKIANTEYLVLNTTAAKAAGATYWNSTSPTSTVFSLGSSTNTNNTNGMEFLCFHSVEGYSKVFSYTGNGSADGTFVYCGFKPRYVLVKRIDSTGEWPLSDTARSTYNQSDNVLWPNYSLAEQTSGYGIDITATGFKARAAGANTNASGGTYIGIAFAEAPTKFATAR